MSGIYAIYHTKYPHKQYIGSTEQEFAKRFSDHKKEIRRGKHRIHLQRICDKHGLDGLRMTVLFKFKAPRSILRHLEQKFIDNHILTFGRNNLLNGTTSAISMLDDPAVIEKTKAINSLRMKQNNADPEYIAKVTAGIREAIAKNPARKEDLVDWAKNGLNSPENRQKCLAAIRKTCAKPVMCVELGISFDATNDAVRWLRGKGFIKANKSAISRCAKGKSKQAYGYTWQYVR